MKTIKAHKINSIIEYHELLCLPAPLHPLVSVVQVSDIDIRLVDPDKKKLFFFDFYCIAFKKNIKIKTKYGQQYYDHDKGVMSFLAPKQLQSIEESDIINQECGEGYILMFHSDFLRNHPLSKLIDDYGFFSYAVNEALHLSEREELDIIDIFKSIDHEYQHIDSHTQDIILSQTSLLLAYSNRFYERQFITRKSVNHDLLVQMKEVINSYFDNEEMINLPTVQSIANELDLSPRYLNDMLRSLTGQNTQQLIHEKLLNKAKEYLISTNLSVAEIAYLLGFEYPQSFNKLFKKKTDMSPLEFRKSTDFS